MSGTGSTWRGNDGITPEDWDLLFDAVADRLERCTRAPQAQPMRDVVQDCVQALQLLHGELNGQRLYLQRIESQLAESCAALAAVRAELADTRISEMLARHLAQHDGLTALPNNSHFRRRLDDALDTGPLGRPTLAVLFVDLEDFKPINDRHGHDTGNDLLRVVAQRLGRAVRADDIVCRLGGDEFACLRSQPMEHVQLSRLARQLFNAVSAPLRLGNLERSVQPSIGIAVCPSDGDATAALLQRADAAMYRAKRGQLGYAFFEDGAAADAAIAMAAG